MTGKTLAAAAVAAVALLVAGSAQPGGSAPAKSIPLLGIVTDRTDRALLDALFRVNPWNLRPLPGPKVRIGYATHSAAVSPDLRLVAIGRYENARSATDADSYVRLVDPRAMKVVADIAVGRGKLQQNGMAWIAPDRLVAFAWCCDAAGLDPEDAPVARGTDLIVVDPVAQRLVERRALASVTSFAAQQARGRLVALTRAGSLVGPLKLLVVEREGIRDVVLDRFEGPGVRALTLRPDGARAFVFSQGVAAEIDLESLAVTYHALVSRRRALATRTKEGPLSTFGRQAAVLSNGLIAVSGWDLEPDTNSHSRRQPIGLQLVDAASWVARTIDPNASSFTPAGNSLLATGERWTSAGLLRGFGLTSYTDEGKRKFQLFKRKVVEVDRVHAARAYVGIEYPMLHVVDTVRGSVLGRRSYKTIPWLVNP